VIRVWEKRYAAVTPKRTESNRRLYSDEHIERLRLLRQLTEAGHSISYVAKLPTPKLHALLSAAAETPAAASTRRNEPANEPAVATLLAKALTAVEGMNAPELGELLKQAEIRLGHQGLLQRLIAPLAQAIGERWRSGAITAAHEHFATAVLRLFLGHAAKPFAATQNAPVLLVATPTGQLHELGALLAGATAASLGWRVVYLGPSLGAAEIAGAVLQNQARALALSLVYPEDDPQLPAELARLRELLPHLPVVVGGRAAPAYREALDRMGAQSVADLVELGAWLDRLRKAR
jgi:DNA-binding transcriptional MerR regulator/methylmalonyl-CoA mutase cobalamin-binding subunit